MSKYGEGMYRKCSVFLYQKVDGFYLGVQWLILDKILIIQLLFFINRVKYIKVVKGKEEDIEKFRIIKVLRVLWFFQY